MSKTERLETRVDELEGVLVKLYGIFGHYEKMAEGSYVDRDEIEAYSRCREVVGDTLEKLGIF